MERTARQQRSSNPVTAVASAAIRGVRRLEATRAMVGTWLGQQRSTSAAQGHYDAEQLAEFQAVIKRDAARLTESLIAPSRAHMMTLLRLAEIACLAPEHVERILNFTLSLRDRDPQFDAALNTALERQAFRASEAEAVRSAVCLVTLGLPCVPWKMLNRWGLRSEADYAACFNPFALASHRLAGVIGALASDFADYCQADQLMLVKSRRGELVPARKDRHVLWSHNRGAHWGDDNFARFIGGMEWKIANFRASCRRPNAVFVMSHVRREHLDNLPQFLPDLQQGLRRHTSRRDNPLILTNQSASSGGNRLERVDDATFVLHCPYPIKGYAWNDDDCYDSPEGFAFERTYVGLICDALRQWGLVGGRRAEPELAAE